MPRQPQWFQYVPDALVTLSLLSTPVVDRACLEKLLHVSRRDAIRLLHRFGGYQAGRTFLVSCDTLRQSLEAVLGDESFQFESRRRQRLSDDLESTRRDLRSRQVKLPVASPPLIKESSLPAGIRLSRPGVLEVEFATANELLARLYELVQLAGLDLDGFEALITLRR